MIRGTPPTLEEFALTEEVFARLKEIQYTATDNEAGLSWMDKLLPKREGCLVELIGALLFGTILWLFFSLDYSAHPWFKRLPAHGHRA